MQWLALFIAPVLAGLVSAAYVDYMSVSFGDTRTGDQSTWELIGFAAGLITTGVCNLGYWLGLAPQLLPRAGVAIGLLLLVAVGTPTSWLGMRALSIVPTARWPVMLAGSSLFALLWLVAERSESRLADGGADSDNTAE